MVVGVIAFILTSYDIVRGRRNRERMREERARHD